MSKYEEICKANATVRENWSQYRDRSWQRLWSIVNGLEAYCEIPPEMVTFLRWNEGAGDARAYVEAENGMRYTLPGATVFDKDDGYWHLGLCITLSRPGAIPPQWVYFVLCVTELDGKPMVKVGVVGKPRQIDFDSPEQLNALYEYIFESVMKCFHDSNKDASKPIGFVVGP